MLTEPTPPTGPAGQVGWNGRVHPALELFPEIDGNELTELAVSIRTAGLLQPGMLLPDGTLIDGRARKKACERAGVPMRWNVCIDTGPVGAVMRLNLQQRQLSAGQKAMLGVDLLPMLKIEAKERQGKRTDLATSAPTGAQVGESHPNRATDQAARLVGASNRNVQRAKRISEADPRLADQVRLGILTTGAAERILYELVKPDAEPTSPDQVLRRIAQRLPKTVAELNRQLDEVFTVDWDGGQDQLDRIMSEIGGLRARLDDLDLGPTAVTDQPSAVTGTWTEPALFPGMPDREVA